MKSKTKKLNGSEDLESDSSPSKNESSTGWVFAILGLLGLGGLVWYFNGSKPKDSEASAFIPGTTRSGAINRTDSQIKALRAGLQSLYSAHGQTLDGARLDAVLTEYLSLEKSMHSDQALKILETELSKTSSRGLVYGNSLGLYGF